MDCVTTEKSGSIPGEITSAASIEMNMVLSPLRFNFSRFRGVSGEPLVTIDGCMPLLAPTLSRRNGRDMSGYSLTML